METHGNPKRHLKETYIISDFVGAPEGIHSCMPSLQSASARVYAPYMSGRLEMAILLVNNHCCHHKLHQHHNYPAHHLNICQPLGGPKE